MKHDIMAFRFFTLSSSVHVKIGLKSRPIVSNRLSFWKHKNMARSIRWSVWRRFLSEENWWNLCDCLRLIGTLVWARFGGTNPSRSRIWIRVKICYKFFAFEFCIQINSIKTFVCIYNVNIEKKIGTLKWKTWRNVIRKDLSTDRSIYVSIPNLAYHY